MPDGYQENIKQAAQYAQDLGNALEAAIGFNEATNKVREMRKQVGTIENDLLDLASQTPSGSGSGGGSGNGSGQGQN